MLTPYQFASNRPIDGIDLDGLEFMKGQTSMFQYSGSAMTLLYSNELLVRDRESYNRAVFGLRESVPNPSSVTAEHDRNTSVTQKAPYKRSSYKGDAKKAIQADESYNRLSTLRLMQKNAASKAGGAQLIANAVDGALLLYHSLKNKKDIQRAVESVDASWQAVELVNKAIASGILPNSIASNATLRRNITNFIIDGKNQASTVDRNLVKIIGKALYKNRGPVMSGYFSFYSTTHRICLGCDTASPVYFDINFPLDNSSITQEAKIEIDSYEARQAKTAPRGATVRPK
jgi:hypothetical protein